MLESGDLRSLCIAKEELFTLLDALSIFTKHEDEEEMKDTLSKSAIFYYFWQ